MTTLSVSKRRPFAFGRISEKSICSIAVVATIFSFAAILADSDFFTYLCAVIALSAVYTLDKRDRKEVEL